MEVRYKKDLRYNYMLIEGNTDRKAEPFSIKLLEHQEIEGMLPVEQKLLDNRVIYYYDITAKQSIITILEKSPLSYDKVISLCSGIIQTVEKAYEYLLPEDDFILTPEYIYVDVITGAPSLCYFPGYGKFIKDQMSGLLEYLMNKVDYNDKDAVFLVYQLYAAGKEEGYTFDHLTEVIQNCGNNRQSAGKSRLDKSINDKLQQSNNGIKTEPDIKGSRNKSDLTDNLMAPPVVMEKVEGEAETTCYSIKTLLYAGVCISGGILVIILSFTTGIIYNTFGNRIDYSKLFALILILLCVEGYLLRKLLDKKNKITKMVKLQEYIDPREDYDHTGSHILSEETKINNRPSIINKENPNERTDKIGVGKFTVTEEDEEFTPTCLLNEAPEKAETPMLLSLDEVHYKNIPITSFPFFIGKLKKNVDYCLEKDVVSRFHAKVTKEGDRFFLTDLNSMNGTFINQELLQTYQKKEIKSGDEIAFANIKYKFFA